MDVLHWRLRLQDGISHAAFDVWSRAMLKSVAQVCAPMSFVALLLVCALVQALSGADSPVFSLVTKTITLDYSVSKDGVKGYLSVPKVKLMAQR